MVKKLIPLLLALCFLLLMMCSCSDSADEAEEVASVETVKDSEGNTFSSLVGADGFLLLGDEDGLAVTVDDGDGKPGKNAKGEFVTRVVDFPDTVQVGKEIHTKFLKLPVPENWTSESDSLIKLRYKKDGLAASLTVNERSGMSVKECQAEIENLMSGIGEAEKEKVMFSFAESVKLNYENRIVIYIFNAEGRTYFVKINADEKLFEEINFEEIINTIKFRKGE